jgi:phosphoglycolate phosphatase
MKSVTHVIWDWNGTLLDDAELCVEVMNGVLARRGLPALTAEFYADRFRFPVRDYYADLGFDFEQESFELVGTEFIEGYAAREASCGLREGARETLEALASRRLTQSVLSASQRARLEAQARRVGVRGHFEALVGLDDHYAHGKLELGQRWMAERGVDPSRTVLVGDTDHDVDVARALGVTCVLVPSGHQSSARLARCGVEVLPGLGALVDRLT